MTKPEMTSTSFSIDDMEDGGEGATSSFSYAEERRRTRVLQRIKLLLLCGFGVVACIAASLAYIALRDGETKLFHAASHEIATTIRDHVESHIAITFQALNNLGSDFSSFVDEYADSWPFVGIPRFESQGRQFAEMTGITKLILASVVEKEDMQLWEYFVVNEELPSELSSSRTVDAEMTNDDFSYNLPVSNSYPSQGEDFPRNYDLRSDLLFDQAFGRMVYSGNATVSNVGNPSWLAGQTMSLLLLQPITVGTSITKGAPPRLAGVLVAVMTLEDYFSRILQQFLEKAHVVFLDQCGGRSFTFRPTDAGGLVFEDGDQHDTRFHRFQKTFPLFPVLNNTIDDSDIGHCQYQLKIHPSPALEKEHRSSQPAVIAVVVGLLFLVPAVFFFLYDSLVSRRHDHLKAYASNTDKMLLAFIPKSSKDGSYSWCEDEDRHGPNKQKRSHTKDALRQILTENRAPREAKIQGFQTAPIADFFPQVSIMFADLVGFTAWSSVREPSQVFFLLETIYSAFDAIARRRNVLKIETVGDCYVAVAGIPESRPDHVVALARFAEDCLRAVNDITARLEVRLGPGTGDLQIRIGIHSGPVTGGVLRGERTRFQLFGDTMNITSLMERTGEANRIHISADTADLLRRNGKSHWLQEREDPVIVAGKGEVTTFWVAKKSGPASVCSSRSREDESETATGNRGLTKKPSSVADREVVDDATHLIVLDKRHLRLVEWNVEVTLKLLSELIARRDALDQENPSRRPATNDRDLTHLEENGHRTEGTVLDEVKEIIRLPNYNSLADRIQRNADSVKISDTVVEQVRDYIQTIAALYRDNPFHNFEHASHVAMATVKLLSRIVSPSHEFDANGQELEKNLHDHTYGITSDPLTRFSCFFSALIHDVDHRGVPNTQLVIDNPELASVYQNRSIAEQNSVDLAWGLLMQDRYKEFRRTIYSTVSGFHRFRSLVVNAVMATDIMDKDLKILRNARWDRAFAETAPGEAVEDQVNRKATIVIEHLIQASDVAHTMQHWCVYIRWNERLFQEMFKSFVQGRAAMDPSRNWYEGELGFFDFYIIPLAKKLKTCGVFGVSSDEFLINALHNRSEWESRGKECLAQYLDKARREEVAALDEE